MFEWCFLRWLNACLTVASGGIMGTPLAEWWWGGSRVCVRRRGRGTGPIGVRFVTRWRGCPRA